MLENIDSSADDIFKSHGIRVERCSRSLSPLELAEIHAEIVCIRSATTITEQVFNKPRLVIAAYCIGTNQIDIPACSRHGCMTFHDPLSNGRSVAEMVVGTTVNLFRGLLDKSNAMHQGKWRKSAANSWELRNKVMGVVGYGNIGQQVAGLAESLGMHVLFYDKKPKAALGRARSCTLDHLLANSDLVTLHVNGDPDNRDLFGADKISAMKQGAFLVNMSRGFVVDEVALATAISDLHIGGAAIDVFKYEPDNGAPFISPLQGLPNVQLTPHVGGSTLEAQRNIAISTSERIVDYVGAGSIQLSPTFPNDTYVSEVRPGAKRVIYIHVNQAGQSALLSSTLANHGLNIVREMLFTNDQMGYAAYDVVFNGCDPSIVERELSSLPGAIRVRIL